MPLPKPFKRGILASQPPGSGECRLMRVSVTEAKARLSELVRRAKAGDGVVLTCHGQPEAQLVPVKRVPIDRQARRKLREEVGRAGRRRRLPTQARREARISSTMMRLCRSDAADASALMAILLREAEAEACEAALEAKPKVMISAGTVAAVLIAAARHNVGERRDCDYDYPL